MESFGPPVGPCALLAHPTTDKMNPEKMKVLKKSNLIVVSNQVVCNVNTLCPILQNKHFFVSQYCFFN
jgi:hypothetical protein